MEEKPIFLKIEENFMNRKTFPFEIYYAYEYPFYPKYEHRFREFKVKDVSIYVESPALEIFFLGLKKKEFYTEDLNLFNNENLHPYLIVYQEGFLKGYQEFDSHIKNSVGIFEKDKESIINTIFDIAYTHISGLSIYHYHKIENDNVRLIKKSSWFESGFKAGKKYKAWFYIINNPQNFVRLFRTEKRLIKFYRHAAQIWKEESGGEGIYSHITNLLQEIDYNNQSPIHSENSEKPVTPDAVSASLVPVVTSTDANQEKKAGRSKEWTPNPTKARLVLNRFDTYLKHEAQKQVGKQNPDKLRTIIKNAIDKIQNDESIGFDEKQLTRYVKHLYRKTAKEYAEHFVRQNFKDKIKGIS